MAEMDVISRNLDPRIRGVVGTNKVNNGVDRIPRPSLDECAKVTFGASFRRGSIVEYNGVRRTVKDVLFYHSEPKNLFRSGNRIVTKLDLGGESVPWYAVKLIKI